MFEFTVPIGILQQVFGRAREVGIGMETSDAARKIADIRENVEFEEAAREEVGTVADVAVARFGDLRLRIENDRIGAFDDELAAVEADLAVLAVEPAEVHRAAREFQAGERLVRQAIVRERRTRFNAHDQLLGHIVVVVGIRTREIEDRTVKHKLAAGRESRLVRRKREFAVRARQADCDRADAARQRVRESRVPAVADRKLRAAGIGKADAPRAERIDADELEDGTGTEADPARVVGFFIFRHGELAGLKRYPTRTVKCTRNRACRISRAVARMRNREAAVERERPGIGNRQALDFVGAGIGEAPRNDKVVSLTESAGSGRESAARVNGRVARIGVQSVRERDVAARCDREVPRAARGSELRVKQARFGKRQGLICMNVNLRQRVGDAEVRAAVAEREIVVVVPRRDVGTVRLNVLRDLTGTNARENETAKNRFVNRIVRRNERLERIDATRNERSLVHGAQNVVVRADRIKNNRPGGAVFERKRVDLKLRRPGKGQTGREPESAEIESRRVLNRHRIESVHDSAAFDREERPARKIEVRTGKPGSVVGSDSAFTSTHRHADAVKRERAAEMGAALRKPERLVVRTFNDQLARGAGKDFVDRERQFARRKLQRQTAAQSAEVDRRVRAERRVNRARRAGNGEVAGIAELPLAREVRVVARHGKG